MATINIDDQLAERYASALELRGFARDVGQAVARLIEAGVGD